MFVNLLIVNYLCAQTGPSAGSWQTWLIPSAKEFRLPPPPSGKGEVAKILAKQKGLDAAQLQQIKYWDAGAPSYRWQEMISQIWMSDALKNGILANLLVSVSVYDATVAAWDSKYAHHRPRPFAVDKRVKTLVLPPESPSYPCEHSVAAGAASTIIAHFFPAMADSVGRLAQQAMDSRVAAGVAFPSDVQAGFDLGKRIAEREIERSKNFLAVPEWDGKVPQGPQHWKGKFAMLPMAGRWKTVVLDTGSQFRPGPPPDYTKDMAELKSHKPNFSSTANAFFHASQPFWDETLNKKMFEYNIHLNPPLAAKMYAAAAIGMYDGFVACWDAKYAYWGIRPEQMDTTFRPVLFRSPPFPGYPSGHAAVSSVQAELLSYFFPGERNYFLEKAKEVAESRFQGGIHFRTDNDVALILGKKVGAAIIQKLETGQYHGKPNR